MLKLQRFLNMRFGGKPGCMCGKINTKKIPSQASRLAHVLLMVLFS